MNQDNQSFAAFIGLDKSDKKINVTLQRCSTARSERSIIQGSAEALHARTSKWPFVWSSRQPGSSMP